MPVARRVGHRRDDPARNADEEQQHEDVQSLRLAHGHAEARGGHMRHIGPDERPRDGGEATHHAIQAIELADALGRCQPQHQRPVRAPDATQRHAGHRTHHEQHGNGQAEQSRRGCQQEGGNPEPEHAIQRSAWPDAVHPAAPDESADHREPDGGRHDQHHQLLRRCLVTARRHGDVHHVQPHERDHRVDGIGVEDAPQQEAQQPGILTAAAQRRPRLRRGLADHPQRQHRPGMRIAALAHEQKTRQRQHQEADGHQREPQHHVSGEKAHADHRE